MCCVREVRTRVASGGAVWKDALLAAGSSQSVDGAAFQQGCGEHVALILVDSVGGRGGMKREYYVDSEDAFVRDCADTWRQ